MIEYEQSKSSAFGICGRDFGQHPVSIIGFNDQLYT